MAASEVEHTKPDANALKDAECRHIDLQVAQIDARMRQPYGPQEGDWLRSERKKLTDRRFTLGCGSPG